MRRIGSANLDELVDQAERAFASRFGREPSWAAAAPGRVNLIGEHTDYNLGHVLPVAIERWCVVVASASPGPQATFVSPAESDVVEVDLAQPVQRLAGGWGNYVVGTAAQFQKRGLSLPNVDAIIASSIPIGSGLSSSAALCVALATVFEQVAGVSLEPRAKVAMCQRAEHDFAMVPCGIMDQTASIMARAGRALHLDCRDESIEHVSMPTRENAILLVVDTGVRHDLATNEYAARRRQCESAVEAIAALARRSITSMRDVDEPMLESCAARMDPVLLRRAHHVVRENDRVIRAISALRIGDLAAFGALMYASHDSLRVDYEVSCAELDCIVHSARAIGATGGVCGARMTGGGFGGCAIVLCDPAAAPSIAARMVADFEQQFGTAPTAFATAATSGACALPITN